jgi:molybdopterin converting factor small subunit
MLRETCGRESEVRETMARTGSDLYEELQREYKLRFSRNRLKLAINDEFCDWNTDLADGDHISIIPPVAGGSCFN